MDKETKLKRVSSILAEITRIAENSALDQENCKKIEQHLDRALAELDSKRLFKRLA